MTSNGAKYNSEASARPEQAERSSGNVLEVSGLPELRGLGPAYDYDWDSRTGVNRLGV